MGTEIAISFTNLRSQLENEKNSLCKIDESIKRIVQTPARFLDDRFNDSTGDSTKNQPRLSNRNGSNNFKHDENYSKRKNETKTVFSRLTTRDDDQDDVASKRMKVSSTVTRELPSRADIVKAQGNDEASRNRNRRMFGSLLGTLQKFKQEEIVLQNKEEKKAQVERKIEEQARQQKEKEYKERRTLFAERDQKKALIKALEIKMARVSEFEKYEVSQKHLENYILTKTSPCIYWLPRRMSDSTEEKLAECKLHHQIRMNRHRQTMQDELLLIEQRCLRSNRNNPTQHDNNDKMEEDQQQHEEYPNEEQPRPEVADGADGHITHTNSISC